MTLNREARKGCVGCNLQPVNHMECGQKFLEAIAFIDLSLMGMFAAISHAFS